MLKTLEWTGRCVRLLDQTALPAQIAYAQITDEKQMCDAIRRLVVRGAPAIGVAAAFGVYLGVRDCDEGSICQRVHEVCEYLRTARPTAVNLFWALDRIKRVAHTHGACRAGPLKQRILDECLKMLDEDARACRAIGEHGLELLRSIRRHDIIRILTHCNAGALATCGCGTALAPVYVGLEQGERFHVHVDETRPLLQGSRITACELRAAGVPVTVICDDMAAVVLRDGQIDAVVVGADRIASNGDAANKIGTLGLAILARYFNIPFIVASPISTIDMATGSGREIPIEQRDSREVWRGFGVQTAPDGVEILNPAFDVTPAALISAIITDRSVVRPPLDLGLAGVVACR